MTASAATKVRSCGQTAGGAAARVTAENMTCRPARAVARAIVLGLPGVRCATRDGVGGADPCRWHGFTCRTTPRTFEAHIRCVNGSRHVAFTVPIGPSSGGQSE
jgi:hypothetical protein